MIHFNRPKSSFAAILIAAAPFLIGRPQTAESEAPPTPLMQMDWLAGTWSGDMGGGIFEAHYSTPADGRILSHSRLLHGEEVAFYEFEVFESEGDQVRLHPYPGGRKAQSFELVSFDAKERLAVFENPEKDYPTRITYQRVEDENLVITLSDPHGTSEQVDRFDLWR